MGRRTQWLNSTTLTLEAFRKEVQKLWEDASRDNLPKRVFKCVLSTTICLIIILLPNIRNVYGRAGYLACMTTVFGHPGRRVGAMVEALTLATLGVTFGVAWATLGTYLGSLAHPHSSNATMAIRAVFIMIAAFVHGYVRISTPRLFILVLLMLIPVIIGLTSPSLIVTTMFPTQFFYPILTAIAVLLLVSVLVFPEFGSVHLGYITVETLQAIQEVQKSASQLFVACAGQKSTNEEDYLQQLKDLTEAKTTLRKKMGECNTIFTECSFEMAYSVLRPSELKPISRKGIKGLVGKTINLIGACESKYALLGVEDAKEEKDEKDAERKSKDGIDVEMFKVKREIESGDEQLLRYLLKRVEQPLRQLEMAIDRSIDVVNTAVAFAYDVPLLPSRKQKQGEGKARRPRGILLHEMDVHIESLSTAIADFGKSSDDALEGAAVLEELGDTNPENIDVMPREEVFLVSSFILNLRQGASHTLDMLRHSRLLLEQRQEKKGVRTIHFPKINWRKWVASGSDDPESLPPANRPEYQDNVRGNKANFPSDKDSLVSQETRKRNFYSSRKKPWWRRKRELFADLLEWITHSEHVLYAFKFTLGVILVTWPSFNGNWLQWFYLYRGVWVGLVFILVFENAVGSTIWIYILRTVGTVAGSVWGYAAYEARNGNEFVIAVMIMLGTIPSFYVQLGTKYQKAGMISTISMCVVALSTHLQTVPGPSKDNFAKRCVTMLIGGAIATAVQVLLFPVKARVRLKESLAASIVQITKMESCIALGVDENRNISTSPVLFKRFERAAKKAGASLTSAEAFLGFTRHEPRLKGSFDDQKIIYKEMIFVLRQIVDRMENMLQLRKAYGSAVLEQYNTRVYPYRRNVAASVTLTLFAVHEALYSKLPLPQFLPSSRLAHRRMIVRIRQILAEEGTAFKTGDRADLQVLVKRRALRLKLLSWNASSAALEEMVEYLEELVELTKILVGVNEFRSGLLHRPNYREYAEKARKRTIVEGNETEELRLKRADTRTLTSHHSTAKSAAAVAEMEEIPDSLTRIQSRRAEARLERQRTMSVSMQGIKER